MMTTDEDSCDSVTRDYESEGQRFDSSRAHQQFRGRGSDGSDSAGSRFHGRRRSIRKGPGDHPRDLLLNRSFRKLAAPQRMPGEPRLLAYHPVTASEIPMSVSVAGSGVASGGSGSVPGPGPGPLPGSVGT